MIDQICLLTHFFSQRQDSSFRDLKFDIRQRRRWWRQVCLFVLSGF
jgi:hypothetical protein